MRDAETVLGIIRERGKEGLPLERSIDSCSTGPVPPRTGRSPATRARSPRVRRRRRWTGCPWRRSRPSSTPCVRAVSMDSGTTRLHREERLDEEASARAPGVAFILHLDASGLRMVQRAEGPLRSAYTLVRRRAAGPAAPHRFAKRGDDLGRQPDPPGPVRHRLDAVQATGLAPGGDGRDVHVQRRRGSPGRAAPVPALPGRAGSRAFRAAAGDPVGVANPLDLVAVNGPSRPDARPSCIQARGDLAVGVARGQLADPVDHRPGRSGASADRGGRDLELVQASVCQRMAT